MVATNSKCPKGSTLLAKAGVCLSDAKWLLRQRNVAAAQDAARVEAIRRKVHHFLASSPAPVRGSMAFA